MKEPKQTLTKGNVIVQKIKIGDIHYEYDYGMGIKCEVITLPKWDSEAESYSWKSKNLNSGKEIDYGVVHKYSHYAPNLYDHEAYRGATYV